MPSCPHHKHFYYLHFCYLHFCFTYSFLLFRQVIHWNKSTKHLEHKISSQSSPIYVGITYYNLQPIHFTCFILFYWYVTNVPSKFYTHDLTFQLRSASWVSSLAHFFITKNLLILAYWAVTHWHIMNSHSTPANLAS